MSLRISPPRGTVLNDRDGASGQSPGNSSSRPQSPNKPDEVTEEPAVIADISDTDPDESEEQFRRTCRKIREIEERARHAHRAPETEPHCSFCNRARSQVGSLCHPDNMDVFICRECAEAATDMLARE